MQAREGVDRSKAPNMVSKWTIRGNIIRHNGAVMADCKGGYFHYSDLQ